MSSPERDSLTIGMPSRTQIIELAEEFRGQFSRRFSVKFREIDFGYSNHILQGRAVEQNPRAIRRPPRATTESGDLTFGATQRGNYKQSASITLGTEDQTARSKTAAAYVKRWARCFDERLQDVLGCVQIKTKRNEDEGRIREQITADLNRAIELDPEVGEYYYLRYSMRRLESDLARAIELDSSIAEAMRDRRRALEEEPIIPDILPTFSWDEFLANPPRPMKIKEPWRLKCLRD